MKHIIRMLHRVTEDQTGVYFSCEENGYAYFTSDLRKNGTFHIAGTGGAPMAGYDMHLFRTDTQERMLSFIPNADRRNMYSGVFLGADNSPVGNINPAGTGSERYYVANLYGNQYECYKWAVGTAPCMMFYKNGIQKAMLVEDKLSVNDMYSMTLHVADDEDMVILCMLGLVYHQFENVKNMNSRFRRSFVRNGLSINFCENVANYRYEVPIKGIGKAMYNIDFLRQFYPEGGFPYQTESVTAGMAVKEMGTGFQQAAGAAWTEENLTQTLKKPVTIALIVGCPILFGIIGGFVGASMLLAMGIDIYGYSYAVRYILGFLVFFVIVGAGEGLFLLLFKGLVKLFDPKNQ